MERGRASSTKKRANSEDYAKMNPSQMETPKLPRKRKDLTGNRYHRLTAVSFVGVNHRRTSVWLCRCDCGNSIAVESDKLGNGNTKSCGCLRRDNAAELGRHFGHNAKHGHSTGGAKSPEYVSW